MKLFLTSNGLSNQSIAKAFNDLIGKEPAEAKIAFIPTAAHANPSNKDWLINDLYRILEQGYYVDIIELTAVKPQQLPDLLKEMDAIFVGGGNTYYLSYWMKRSGLTNLLPEFLKSKTYAGISAGSIVTGNSLALTSQALENPQAFQDEYYDSLGPKGESSGEALKLVDFIFRPHLNSRYFSLVRKDILEEKAKQVGSKVYALDDNSALKIIDDHIEVVSEGEWLTLNDDKI